MSATVNSSEVGHVEQLEQRILQVKFWVFYNDLLHLVIWKFV